MVENGFKPTLGLMFVKLEEAIEFYNLYLVACGFIPRKYTQTRFRDGLIDKKSMVANRHGFKEDRKKLKLVVEFENTEEKKKRGKGHNHKLCSLKEREFQKNVRTLNLYMKQTIVNNCKLNIGATRTFRILAEQSNGYANIGASLTDFKNFKRNIKCYIGENDADMILDYLKALSQTQDGFYYAYQVDEDNCLAKLFWADAQARMNYSLFGDTITFDPTYGTNKYRMAFTPFTSVLTTTKIGDFFAAHLSIMRTMGHSFGCLRSSLIVWATRNLSAFLLIKIRQLNSGCVSYSSKQDIAHRMWHIMKKLTDKVESRICKERPTLLSGYAELFGIRLGTH
ncbi:protein FAR1-RELATED SEQUENCE 5-like [Silene latifolia]|uniref:protein FAR1-RELATED SEQUENCE 5-like n=1 Tax=Silene latifolia TaxID=37657 RepID=UPI003D780082